MKKIIIIFIAFTPFVLRAQNVNGSDTAAMARRNSVPSNIAIMDSLISQKVSKIIGYLEPQRFKMYQTENIYNLLKLDTWTGRVWQVQWGDTEERVEVTINYRDLRDRPTGKDNDYEYAAKIGMDVLNCIQQKTCILSFCLIPIQAKHIRYNGVQNTENASAYQ